MEDDLPKKMEDEELQKDIEREKKEAEEEKKRKYRLEKAMSTADLSALFAENQRIASMNSIIQTAVAGAYIVKSIPGGTYNDTVTLVDSKILDSQSGLRNGFAQQLLHQEMVDMQYDMSN